MDLHCKDPDGNIVSFQNKTVPSGGYLDVDENAGSGKTIRPVENIVWDKGKGKEGKYEVFVHYYSHRTGDIPVDYTVRV